MPKSFQNLRTINDFGLFGPSWRTSWRPLGPSWRLLGRTWRYLGPSWAVLEAVLDHLGRTWRPSWTILEAILGQRGHLGSHLGPSWRIFFRIEVLSASFRVAGGTCRSPRGSSFGKRTKTKPPLSSTPCTPAASRQGAADLMAFGSSRHRAWVVGQSPQG